MKLVYLPGSFLLAALESFGSGQRLTGSGSDLKDVWPLFNDSQSKLYKKRCNRIRPKLTDPTGFGSESNMAEKVAVFIFLSSTARIPGSVGSKQNIKLCYLFNTSPRPTRTERNVQKHGRKRDREERETHRERRERQR